MKIRYITIICFCLIANHLFSQKKWSLEECIKYGHENNFSVLKEKIKVKINESDVKIAKGNYLPDVKFSAHQNLFLGNSFNVSTNVGQRESSSNSFRLSSSLTIFNGFSNKYKLQKSKLSAKKVNADINKIQFDLSLNITNKYLQVLFNKELLNVAIEQIKISKKNNSRLKKLYKNGLIGKFEILEIGAVLAIDIKERVLAKKNIENSLIKLQELLGIEQFDMFDIKTIAIDDVILIANTSSEYVVENNPHIQSSLFYVELKKRDVLLSKINFYPTVNLNYSYSSNYFHIIDKDDVVYNQVTNEFVSNGFWKQLNNNRTHYIGISATIPIFNRFLTQENYKKSKEELKLYKVNLKRSRQELKNKIKLAENNLVSSISIVESSKIAFQMQQEAFGIIQRQYRNGNCSNLEFLQSKNKLAKNSSEYIKSRYDFFFKSKILTYYFK